MLAKCVDESPKYGEEVSLQVAETIFRCFFRLKIGFKLCHLENGTHTYLSVILKSIHINLLECEGIFGRTFQLNFRSTDCLPKYWWRDVCNVLLDTLFHVVKQLSLAEALPLEI